MGRDEGRFLATAGEIFSFRRLTKKGNCPTDNQPTELSAYRPPRSAQEETD